MHSVQKMVASFQPKSRIRRSLASQIPRKIGSGKATISFRIVMNSGDCSQEDCPTKTVEIKSNDITGTS